jgi:beta-glucosidase
VTVLWGAASSSAHAEGLAPAADAFSWQKSGRLPNSSDGNGMRTQYRDDVELFASNGLSVVNLGIEWARIEPQPGKIDGDALEHYSLVLQTARQAGLSVWVTLQNRTVPGWFVDEGGFIDDKSRGYFWPRFVDVVASELGSEIDAWVPIHDPSGYASLAYSRGMHPPAKKDPELRAKALRGTWLAWRDAWRLLRGNGAPVVHSLSLAPVFTMDGTVEGGKRAKRVDEHTWDVAVRAIRDGELAVPGLAVIEVPDLQDSGDIVGVAYQGALAASGDKLRTYPPAGRRGDDGLAVWSEGLALTLHRLAEMLPQRPLAVTSYGAPTSDAAWQGEEARLARAVILEAVSDGIPIEAALWWSAIDGWSFERGFSLATGLFTRDREPRPALSAWTGRD